MSQSKMYPVAAVSFGAISAAGLAFGLGVWGLVAGFYASAFTRASVWKVATIGRSRRCFSWCATAPDNQ